jgi:mitochondrial import inner membrane translocase subunit TIM17
MDREPCPHRLWGDFGGAFAMGGVGGAVWHAYKGARNSPKGARVAGSLVAVRTRAPILGGQFAAWGGLFSTFDCCLEHARGTQDVINPILSGAVTGGVLAARSGWKNAGRSALFGGVILAVIEGVAHLLTNMGGEEPPQVMPPEQFPGAIPSPQRSIAQERQRAIDSARGGFGEDEDLGD